MSISCRRTDPLIFLAVWWALQYVVARDPDALLTLSVSLPLFISLVPWAWPLLSGCGEGQGEMQQRSPRSWPLRPRRKDYLFIAASNNICCYHVYAPGWVSVSVSVSVCLCVCVCVRACMCVCVQPTERDQVSVCWCVYICA
jgi:hypothetical protein